MEGPKDSDTIRPLSAPREGEAIPPLKVKVLEHCDFPMVERDLDGYKVLVLPPSIQNIFDKEGYDALRINSRELGEKFPQYGGKTTEGRSLLPHQDHAPNDQRRFLALSKISGEERDSTTYLVQPEIVRRALPEIQGYLDAHRDTLQTSFAYLPSSQVSEKDLISCFESGGLDRLVEKTTGKNADANMKLFAYAGILGYLITGKDADALVEQFLKEHEKEIVTEEWKTDGTLIIDNSKVFHGRRGPNNPLKRNWLVAE